MNFPSYPIVFRTPVWQRLVIICVGIFLCFVGAVMLTLLRHDGGVGLIVGLAILILGVVLPLLSITSRLELYHDRIAQSSAFGQRELYRHDIDGYRRRIVKNATMIDVMPLHQSQKKITVSKPFSTDPQFISWLMDLRNLDEIDERLAQQEIAHDVDLGATPEERMLTLKNWRRTLNVVGYGFIALSIGMFFLPVPSSVLILFLLSGPWLCIGLLAKSRHFTLIELDKVNLLRKLNLQPLMMFSSVSFYMLLLGIRPGLATFPLHWQKPLIMGLTGGLSMLFLVICLSRGAKLTWTGIFGIFPSLVIYAGGAVILLNTTLDHHEATRYELVVVGKHMTTGKGAANYLDVRSRDETYRGDTSFKVSRSAYDATPIGNSVCASIHPGAFYMPWENLVPCDMP